jgi:hypothetical protein
MKRKSNSMRIELSTAEELSAVNFMLGAMCPVCGHAIDGPPALWLAVESMDFFVHKDCETGFTSEAAKRHIGEMVLVMQDECLNDIPPERN